MPASVTESDLAMNGGAPVCAAPIPFVAAGLAEEDIEAAIGVLRSGMLRQGKKSDAFEERFARMTDAPHARTCANGTCALQLAYGALLEPGDEVLVCAWTYIATASMIAAAGATPVFCEVDPDTYNIDAADAAQRITDRTRAIAVTHLYGNPADIDAIQTLASKHDLRVIYDAAQAHFATYRGRGLGAYGDAVTYSFYPTKNIATGEGGMVTTRDATIDRQVALLRSHGETDKYVHEVIGFNYRMTDVEAAIGLSQLDRAEAMTAARRRNGARLDQLVGEIAGLMPPAVTEGGEHAYHQYAIRMEPGAFRVSRDEFIRAVIAEGVPCAVHYPRALTHQPAFSQWVREPMPVSESLAGSLFCVPVHQNLTGEHLARIGEALEKVGSALSA